ncbi:MAG: DUF1697 domain-containing protein [Nocardioides sp.]
MTTYVAFLRAINLGGNRTFPKDSIVAATEGVGFTGVATHINTGNVRFETSLRSRSKIESTLEQAYLDDRGFDVPTIVFTSAEIAEICAEAERLASDHSGNHYVSLLKDEPGSAATAEIEGRSVEGARVVVSGRSVHLLLGESYRESLLSNVHVEKVLGVATNRRLTVIRALAEKWC